MDKQTLMGFVNRFYLGGQTQSAPIVSTKDTLSCSFINSAKSCVGDIVSVTMKWVSMRFKT